MASDNASVVRALREAQRHVSACSKALQDVINGVGVPLVLANMTTLVASDTLDAVELVSAHLEVLASTLEECANLSRPKVVRLKETSA